MKLAIVHDWFVSVGGAEKVLAKMLDIYPEADVFSVVDFFDDDTRQKLIKGKLSNTTFIQRFPFAKKMYRSYLPFMPLAVEQLDLSSYDLVISSSHAVAKGVITSPNQLHICYCHSPIRYAWDLQEQYLRESGLQSGLKSLLARIMLFKIRGWDYRTSNGVDFFISNSDYIGKRIWKIYRRKSHTIYPNVAVDEFDLISKKDDFYFTASRLVPYKKIDLIVRAFSNMPDKKLVVIGDGPQLEKVKAAASPNVTIMGYQSFDILKDYMQRARAFVFAAEEDFGIIPVEAQACGTPVIAFGKGGTLETVLNGKTGVFFEEQTENSIINAVMEFENNFVFEPSFIRQHAEKFSADIFKEKFREFVQAKYSEFELGKGRYHE
ncbi:glycosyltransferase family 4 protein [Gallaecimonas mangrovi]|uniref:glycosyltransferase family 4 protein n=1 Tax=Gallaecimonas mangrovi TaxID=2291597 RepID=UPI000E207B93|nr:glycosyltransferase family 4 protein [Gallaecimonas mangrovi]